MHTTDDKLAYSIPGAARAIECSERHIYNLVAAGKLRIVKSGRKSLIPARDLRAIVEAA
jgi:excisionase family DNA binding protein